MTTTKLPRYRRERNAERAAWAKAGLDTMQALTRTDDEDVVCDFLANLMHWCDQNGVDFVLELSRGSTHYTAEIDPKDDIG